ncbi:NAD-dependent epimerase/dehydratase family protein [Roseococcus sp. YIM B11640]|uniref:NAD-dependent epimerase/dehydratase family protein n=1 Tax=Roseococcus sp. YIM B11640 TaxID=3133973 RepID=UPI003C79ECB4
MRILITGAAGFIGRRLTRELRVQGRLCGRPLGELVLVDIVPPPDAEGCTIATGSIGDADFLQGLFAGPGYDVVFHLAASLTQEAERDMAHGLAVNIEGMLRLLGHLRAQHPPARLVFASSIAAFGGVLPDVVGDDTPRLPRTSYGTQKAIAELLLADHARQGVIDARALRLPIVVIRPGAPSPAVSDQVAAILREPLNGRDVVCGLRPETRLPLASVGRVARSLRLMAEVPGEALPDTRAINQPALTVSVAEMVAALDAHHAMDHVSWRPDPALQAVVDSWPRGFRSATAERLGIQADTGLDAIIEDYLSAG